MQLKPKVVSFDCCGTLIIWDGTDWISPSSSALYRLSLVAAANAKA